MRIYTSAGLAIAMCGALWACNLLRPCLAFADEVVLNSGEKFVSSKVWEENGKIRFNMHGLVVSVDPSDVETIIRSEGGHQPPTQTRSQPQKQAPTPPTAPVQPRATPSPDNPTPAPPLISPPSQRSAPAPKSSGPTQGKRSGIGLSGIAWSMTPSQLSGLEKVKTEPEFGGIDHYWRPQEPVQLGHALLDGKVYGFWRDRLYSIMMWAEGRIGYERLRKAVFRHYGKGHKNAKGLERYVWMDASTDRMLEYDDQTNNGFFWMRSRKLDAQIKQLYPEK